MHGYEPYLKMASKTYKVNNKFYLSTQMRKKLGIFVLNILFKQEKFTQCNSFYLLLKD